jgi:hypothetical protein
VITAAVGLDQLFPGPFLDILLAGGSTPNAIFWAGWAFSHGGVDGVDHLVSEARAGDPVGIRKEAIQHVMLHATLTRFSAELTMPMQHAINPAIRQSFS